MWLCNVRDLDEGRSRRKRRCQRSTGTLEGIGLKCTYCVLMWFYVAILFSIQSTWTGLYSSFNMYFLNFFLTWLWINQRNQNVWSSLLLLLSNAIILSNVVGYCRHSTKLILLFVKDPQRTLCPQSFPPVYPTLPIACPRYDHSASFGASVGPMRAVHWGPCSRPEMQGTCRPHYMEPGWGPQWDSLHPAQSGGILWAYCGPTMEPAVFLKYAPLCPQCIQCAHSLPIVPTLYAHSVSSVPTVCPEFGHNMRTVCPQYIHSVHCYQHETRGMCGMCGPILWGQGGAPVEHPTPSPKCGHIRHAEAHNEPHWRSTLLSVGSPHFRLAHLDPTLTL